MVTQSDNIDEIDLIGVVLFPIAAGLVFGVWSFELDVFDLPAMTDPMFTIGETQITYAVGLALIALVWIAATNEFDGSEYESYEYAILGFALISVPAHELVPAFEDLVQSSDVVALGMFLLVSIAAAYIAYTE